jgi:hypothetical protein
VRNRRPTPLLEGLRRLQGEGRPFPISAVPGFHGEIAPVDESGRPLVIGPGTPWPLRPDDIGPVRVWGYITGTRPGPLAHAKVLVLGQITYHEDTLSDLGSDVRNVV